MLDQLQTVNKSLTFAGNPLASWTSRGDRRIDLLLPRSFPCVGQGASPSPPQARPAAPVQQKPQTRLHGQPVQVDPASVTIDDGDSIFIRWADGDLEMVRILTDLLQLCLGF